MVKSQHPVLQSLISEKNSKVTTSKVLPCLLNSGEHGFEPPTDLTAFHLIQWTLSAQKSVDPTKGNFQIQILEHKPLSSLARGPLQQ